MSYIDPEIKRQEDLIQLVVKYLNYSSEHDAFCDNVMTEEEIVGFKQFNYNENGAITYNDGEVHVVYSDVEPAESYKHIYDTVMSRIKAL